MGWAQFSLPNPKVILSFNFLSDGYWFEFCVLKIKKHQEFAKEFNLQAIYKYAYASKNKKDHSSGSDLF